MREHSTIECSEIFEFASAACTRAFTVGKERDRLGLLDIVI